MSNWKKTDIMSCILNNGGHMSVTKLVVDGNEIASEEEMTAIMQCFDRAIYPRLQTLTISYNVITLEQVTRLAAAISQGQLPHLILDFKKIESAAVQLLLNSIDNNAAFTEVQLQLGELSLPSLQALKAHLHPAAPVATLPVSEQPRLREQELDLVGNLSRLVAELDPRPRLPDSFDIDRAVTWVLSWLPSDMPSVPSPLACMRQPAHIPVEEDDVLPEGKRRSGSPSR